jgi:hypothetical protein
MPVHPLTARVLGPAVVCIVVSTVAWAPGISDEGLLIVSAQAQRAQKSPTEQLRSQVETLINRLRGRDMPEGIVKSNGRIEATQVDVAAKYPGRLATLTVDEGDEVTGWTEGRHHLVARNGSPAARRTGAGVESETGIGGSCCAHRPAQERLGFYQNGL